MKQALLFFLSTKERTARTGAHFQTKKTSVELSIDEEDVHSLIHADDLVSFPLSPKEGEAGIVCASSYGKKEYYVM